MDMLHQYVEINEVDNSMATNYDSSIFTFSESVANSTYIYLCLIWVEYIGQLFGNCHDPELVTDQADMQKDRS